MYVQPKPLYSSRAFTTSGPLPLTPNSPSLQHTHPQLLKDRGVKATGKDQTKDAKPDEDLLNAPRFGERQPGVDNPFTLVLRRLERAVGAGGIGSDDEDSEERTQEDMSDSDMEEEGNPLQPGNGDTTMAATAVGVDGDDVCEGGGGAN